MVHWGGRNWKELAMGTLCRSSVLNMRAGATVWVASSATIASNTRTHRTHHQYRIFTRPFLTGGLAMQLLRPVAKLVGFAAISAGPVWTGCFASRCGLFQNCFMKALWSSLLMAWTNATHRLTSSMSLLKHSDQNYPSCDSLCLAGRWNGSLVYSCQNSITPASPDSFWTRRRRMSIVTFKNILLSAFAIYTPFW